jgi:SAM-dependent methyltransferase
MLPLNVDWEEYNILDLGCGTGLALMYIYNMKKFYFKNYEGIEINSRFLLVLKNFLIKRKVPLEIYHSDIKDFVLRNEKYLLYMFNPTDWITLLAFLNLNQVSLSTKQSIIIYKNDIYINEMLNNFSNLHLIHRDNKYNISILEFLQVQNDNRI